MISSWALLATAGVLGLFYALYRWALPSPIPGIPYNEEASRRLLGDIPDMLREVRRTGDVVQWILQQKLKTPSPISQVFMKPFGRPFVLVTDWRAARDVLLHSSRTFDRSTRVADIFGGLIAGHQITMKTGPEWKHHRRLVQDTMSPAFLHTVAAPVLYQHSLEMVRLWDLKARQARGRPFEASDDIFHAVLDAVLGFTFGGDLGHSAVRPQIAKLMVATPEELHPSRADEPRADSPMNFPRAPIDEVLEAILKLDESMEDVKSSPAPRWKWRFVHMTASFRKHARVKDTFIDAEIAKACAAHAKRDAAVTDKNTAEPDFLGMRSAAEIIVAREARLARLEGRPPAFFSRAVRAEVFGLVVAGHDTTSTTLCWAVKLLADHGVAAQTRLRRALRTVYADAYAAKRAPSVDALLSEKVPLLEATVEEILRCAATVPFGDRETLEDTTLLGARIPKGTGVFFLHNGPGVRLPEAAANHAKYAASEAEKAAAAAPESQGAPDIPPWDDEDVARFRPERWLKEVAADEGIPEVTFDGRAGPSMPFGLGLRSCFGRRLAYLQLRLLLAMMVWHFDFLPCPDALSGYTGVMAVVYKPQQCYVRLRKVEL